MAEFRVMQEILDEDDEKLKELRNEYGDVVFEAVSTALMEMNEYNVSGRYPVREVWNRKEERKATMKEIMEYTIKQLKNHKGKRKRMLFDAFKHFGVAGDRDSGIQQSTTRNGNSVTSKMNRLLNEANKIMDQMEFLTAQNKKLLATDAAQSKYLESRAENAEQKVKDA
ncbi:Laminin subunit alpha-2 [Gossypium arboreum]|uniref:Laminin subunit alpha-2 n=1 Tax=Gossypium arboreum TaxID=29729 RepID=A0A0B0N3V2_GOSAR|nr:Laminin subunit alpha-2 [Gossypium arboreum]